jgi:hypothetical protein
MKILSFDVGIKNMAYCILEIDSSNISIIDWSVINLMDETVSHTCTVIQKNKKSCKSKAKYFLNNYYCEKHAKSSDILINDSRFSSSKINKMKKNELIEFIDKYNFKINKDQNKDSLVKETNEYINKNLLQKIKINKKTASEMDLISIGKNMKQKMNIPSFQDIDLVLIENQISPIATRMKTIQGMLAQFFIMINENIQIQFISSKNKLKGLETNYENITSQYKQHKKDAIFYTNNILEKHFPSWKHIMESSKKDDLADAFLQGLMYIKQKYNIIRV